MTNMIGVAQFLASHKSLWQGTVVLVGQPAEERGAGAQAMLDDGLFDRFPRPDFALALHVVSEESQDRPTSIRKLGPGHTQLEDARLEPDEREDIGKVGTL